MIKTMGLSDRLYGLIMKCVTSVSFSFMLNGKCCDEFVPKGVLDMGLSCLMNAAVAKGSIRGFKVDRGAPPVSHLLFVDDCMLLLRTKQGDCDAIHDVLNHYERASGQKINFDESRLWFSMNTSHNAVDLSHSSLRICN